MDWIPIVFVIFKLLVLCTGMFFAVKWHYDQGKKDKDKKKELRVVLAATGKVIVLFAVLLVVLWYITFSLTKMLGMEA